MEYKANNGKIYQGFTKMPESSIRTKADFAMVRLYEEFDLWLIDSIEESVKELKRFYFDNEGVNDINVYVCNVQKML